MSFNNHEFISMFEKELSEFTGAPYVVLTDSCTNAMFLTLKYLNLNTLVSIPRHTYVSVPQSIIHSGNDITWNNKEWVGSYELGSTNVIDSAVRFKRDMYEDGKYICLSFQQKKPLPIGKGGAILLNDKEDYTILKRMAWDGRDASLSVKEDLPNIILGYHMNMTPEDATKGLLLLNQYKGSNEGCWEDYPCLTH